MMKDYYQQSMRALQLAGMSDRTQQCYTRSVRMLVDFYKKPPDLITEKELQDYFLHLKEREQMVHCYDAHLLQRHQVLLYQCAQTKVAHP